MHRPFNPNPQGKRVGDCAVRAVARATGQSWARAYLWLCVEGFLMGDMPNANSVWGAYLRKHGFKRRTLPDDCPDCYTVADFCRDHPDGLYVLGTGSHVVCVEDGDFWDSWDSADVIPTYYFFKEA